MNFLIVDSSQQKNSCAEILNNCLTFQENLIFSNFELTITLTRTRLRIGPNREKTFFLAKPHGENNKKCDGWDRRRRQRRQLATRCNGDGEMTDQ